MVLIAICAAHTDWFMYSAPTLTHCAPPLVILAWFNSCTSKSILISVLFTDGLRVMFPSSKNAMSFRPSFADDFIVVLLTLEVRCSLTEEYLASVSRIIGPPKDGSLILAVRGVDSGMSIVRLNWTLRPVNCQSVDLSRPNLNSEAWRKKKNVRWDTPLHNWTEMPAWLKKSLS